MGEKTPLEKFVDELGAEGEGQAIANKHGDVTPRFPEADEGVMEELER